MKKIVCDRCGAEIMKNSFRITFSAEVDEQGKISMDGAVVNSNSFCESLKGGRDYCYDCLRDIYTYAYTKPQKKEKR